MMKRETKIERHKQVWLTRESYNYLRDKKRRSIQNGDGKSMTEILNTMIKIYKNEHTGTKK